MAESTRYQRGQRPIGASTITQQVVRHFLLSNEVSVSRKIKEALLAYRIEHELSKDRILEIYLNEIYLGAGAYGVAAAADTYFQKPLDKLTLAETAFIAALPKAPNNYNPVRHPQAAKARRDWVLAGMAETGWHHPDAGEGGDGRAARRACAPRARGRAAGYFARGGAARAHRPVRRKGGLRRRVDRAHELYAVVPGHGGHAFREGLSPMTAGMAGAARCTHLPNAGGGAEPRSPGIADRAGIAGWQLAAVTAVEPGGAHIVLKKGGQGRIPAQRAALGARDPRRSAARGRRSAASRRCCSPATSSLSSRSAPRRRPAARRAAPSAQYALRQIPDVSGGFVVIDPKTGRVFAMVGGWSFQQSQFNRATQAKRQPGSAFKPFVYVTALENGFSPYSVVEDAPISIPQGPGLPPWEPVNYEGSYVGETTLSDALVHSRNLVTARLAVDVGLPAIAKTVENFDVMDKMPLYYSMALGAGETTLLRLTSAYAMIDNGGHWLLPSVVDSVQDRNGRVIYQKGVDGCAACFVAAAPAPGAGADPLYTATGAADRAIARRAERALGRQCRCSTSRPSPTR